MQIAGLYPQSAKSEALGVWPRKLQCTPSPGLFSLSNLRSSGLEWHCPIKGCVTMEASLPALSRVGASTVPGYRAKCGWGDRGTALFTLVHLTLKSHVFLVARARGWGHCNMPHLVLRLPGGRMCPLLKQGSLMSTVLLGTGAGGWAQSCLNYKTWEGTGWHNPPRGKCFLATSGPH